MSVAGFLDELRGLGVKLRREGNDLVCDAPVGIITPAIRERLSRDKSDILRLLLETDVASVNGKPSDNVSPVLRPREPNRYRIPQSSAQQRLWYLDQLDPGQATYNIWMAFELLGTLDVESLRRSFQEVVRRHEALRTTFALDDGEPMQVIAADLTVDLQVVTPVDAPPAERDEWVRRTLENTAGAAFDLAEGPLVRALLVRIAGGRHVFLFVTHHTVVDGWSLSIIRRELMELYDAFTSNHDSPLPEPSLQYPDFALWHNEWLQGEEIQHQLGYWVEQLGNDLPFLDLPTDHARPSQRTERGNQVSLRLSPSLVASLTKVGRAQGATLFMVLLTTFKVLLARYTRQDDIVVGSPIANRMLPEIEDIVGFFANTLVFRTRLDHDLSFSDALARVRTTCLAAYGNQDVPFERLVEELNPVRTMDRTPLFQAFLAFQDHSGELRSEGDVQWTPRKIRNHVARTDVALWLESDSDGIDATFEYSTDLFEASTVARMAQHFARLLEGVVTDSGGLIDELPLLGTAEREQLLTAWNATAQHYPREQRVDQLFAAQAQGKPDAVAVECGEVAWTYATLAERSATLASRLRGLGVGPGSLVGICLERSAEMLVAVLGTLEAGGAYVPLDPSFPQDRLDYMLSDSGATVLVTQESLVDRYQAYDGARVCLDAAGQVESARAGVEPAVTEAAVTPDDLAYVIYTSGSTGRPKGVQVPHRAVVNFLTAMADTPGLGAADRLLAVTTLSFDISVLELLLPLSVGATTVIADDEAVLDGGRLSALVTEQAITVMQATPSTWRLMLDAGWAGEPTLKVLCGGEKLPAGLARELVPRCGELWNMYGPTETTIWSSCCRITGAEDTVSVGRPISNTQFYILDAHQQPVPVGVPGELYIGGDGVTCGYLNREALTADKFVADPFRGDGGRLYRTGDRARYLPDGRVDLLGRTDYQVKVRGYRIELGEIEAVLEAHDDIAEAVAVVHGADTDDPRLAAYVVYHNGTFLTVSDVRRYTRQSLPDYMVPGLVIELDALPRTPNGKVDRSHLPDPMSGEDRQSVVKVPPESHGEQLIAEVWQDLLPGATIGRHDNFFELGGHSLLSLKAIAAIEHQTGHRLDPRLFFFQTLEQLGMALGSQSETAR